MPTRSLLVIPRSFAIFLALAAIVAPPGEALAAASAWWRSDHGEVRLIAAGATTGGASEIPLGLHFRMRPGWKIYWRSPGDGGYPPRPDWGRSVNLAGAELSWPAPMRFSVLGLETLGYRDEVVLPVAARVVRVNEAVQLRLDLPFLTCSEICVPYQAKLELDLPAGPEVATGESALIDRFAAKVPRRDAQAGLELARAEVAGGGTLRRLYLDARSDVPLAAPDVFVEGPEKLRFGAPELRFSADRRQAFVSLPVDAAAAQAIAGVPLTVTLVDGAHAIERTVVAVRPGAAPAAPLPSGGLVGMALLALLGGLILNLMPCVLPVLSIKLLSVVGKAGATPRAARRGFLASAAGIVVSFLVLGTVAVALKASGQAAGWGIQFQEPVFLAAMMAILLLFAANLWGWFDIRLPRALADRLGTPRGKADSGLVGHFLTGSLATLLATSCSAPFLGTAVGFALSRGAGEIYVIFAALGLGLAAPYLVVAGRPRLATALPRPGPWMVTLRRVLGVALVATAAWLGTVLSGVVGPVASVADGVGKPPAVESVVWRNFDGAAIAREVALGRVVLVDVTADWCLTCKVNQAVVFNDAAVVARLNAPGVTAMRADWTRPNDAIAAYLAGQGRYGIPFNAVYGPRLPAGQALPEILTGATVRAALGRAAAP